MALLNASDWDRTKAGMLLQRAGFGGTPDEVDALAKLPPAEAAESLLGTSKFLASDPPSFLGEMNIKDLTQEERAKMSSLSEEGKQKAKREFAQYARALQNQRRSMTLELLKVLLGAVAGSGIMFLLGLAGSWARSSGATHD